MLLLTLQVLQIIEHILLGAARIQCPKAGILKNLARIAATDEPIAGLARLWKVCSCVPQTAIHASVCL